MPTAFFAFPRYPEEIGYDIQSAVAVAKNRLLPLTILPWTDLNVSGKIIPNRVLASISASEYFFADLTVLNLNVVFELGFAIGRRRKIRCFLHKDVDGASSLRSSVGIFDILGWQEYCTSEQLFEYISLNWRRSEFIDFDYSIDANTPIFFLDAFEKTDLVRYAETRAKQVFVHYRSFDPQEKARLSFDFALEGIGRCAGAIILAVPPEYPGANIHNIRAAFLAGLGTGLDRQLAILQLGEGLPPMDFRDNTETCINKECLDNAISNFAARLMPILQGSTTREQTTERSFLAKLQIGSSIAENEDRDLPDYFHTTDDYLRASRGEIDVVLGRKGSGKTAIFIRLAAEKRRTPHNVVVELRPEGYQLIKFKESLVNVLQYGTLEHVITAIWDYVLLLEIATKLLEEDYKLSRRDHEIYQLYTALEEACHGGGHGEEGDFSERLSFILTGVSDEIRQSYDGQKQVTLTTPEITGLIYKHKRRNIKQCVLSNFE